MSAHSVAAVRVPTQPKSSASTSSQQSHEFTLHLHNFEGPFDLLLQLIARHRLDITEIALAQVTDEFIGYINRMYELGTEAALDQASDFLVTAATLLDIKAARLLPQRAPETTEEFAALEARDLLFARLLQYRAYKEVASVLEQRFGEESSRYMRDVTLEPRFAKALPELVFDVSPEEFASIAYKALSTAEESQSIEQVETEHLRAPLTTIAAQEQAILDALETEQTVSFEELASRSQELEIAVVRFLAMLELYKEHRIDVRQDQPLASIILTKLASRTVETEHGKTSDSARKEEQ